MKTSHLQTDDIPVSGIALTADEKHTLLHLFNDTRHEFPAHETLMSLFARQVRQTPLHTAVECQGRSITYQELDEQSNRVANCLLAHDAGAGKFVPVWFDRSIEWLAAVIGILKTGAAYIPIDPAYPLKRVEYILSDAGAALIITGKTHGASLQQGGGTKILYIEDMAAFDATPVATPANELAYVIYTSGSTGNPKGVMIRQEAVVNLITWHIHRFGVSTASRLTLVAGLAFDISVWEIWSALLSGATLCIAGNEERTHAQTLLEFYRRNRITHAFTPAVLAPGIVERSSGDKSLQLEYLFTGGEQLQPVLTGSLSYTLVDYYGPTECTIFATYRLVKDKNGAYVSSIGTPVANTQAYVIGQQDELLPVGATGELCISGICLSPGYLHNETLTAEKFIPHPFIPGEKLYRTGDLACRLPDGSIRFLGRIDNQVKIRGFRIELGEIERSLLKIPGISNAVVIAKENTRHQKYLIAFYVQEGAPDLATIRQELRAELPGYMIPAQFIPVAAIPLTPNGKADKARLAELAAQHAEDTVLAEPPSNDTERVISEIWARELERPVINMTDNFFDIGGDSLLVAVVTAAMRHHLQVKTYMRDIYEYPVLQDLAAMLIGRATEGEQELPVEDVEPYVELQNDVFLAPGTSFAGTFDASVLSKPSAIFLTGATGFVGIHLLADLLQQTSADIYCLVRAKDEYQAMEKIMQCFSRYRIDVALELQKRIIPVTGDLSKIFLGLPEKQYRFLSQKIDVIYHSGSSVNFIEPYSYMKAPNVTGIREIIRLAGAVKLKCLVLLSTISVYSWGHVFTHKTVMKETDDIAQNLLAVSKDIGYVRSKWVMEAIADLAAAEGLPVITYRLGYAMCHSTSGASADYQWWSGLVRNCIEFGAYPQLTELREGLITVDYMTRAMVHISRKEDAIGRKFNLIASPDTNLTLEAFFALLQKHYPFQLKGLPYREWRAIWENDSSNRLYPLTSLFRDNMHEGLSTVELYQHTYVWDCENVVNFLKDSDIREPVFDKQLLDQYLQYLGIPVS
ncbi:amino acid adenylation domain-containing protein [Chitinophaga lutea]|uniref:Amino acid adenylation domain-containing protein n=1 Tax=Chitinophaga lutea TaxID=2488634 RepID=A0A3N4PMC2_9BACT|nr:non-ribosomal peptide synthetase [Chitinophaga lutea]RPE05467.1 amino acid adenylation domain-containing protein [Chitinophaga lutea]